MEPSQGRGDSGRRGNGLASADWGALVDLDPRLSEALLSRLAEAGVAAYVEPALDSNTFTRAAGVPDRPLDRLWVDPARADAARDVVGSEVADLTALLAEEEPGATAHGFVQPVPRTAARRVLPPPPLPGRAILPPPAATPPPATDPDEEFRRIVEGFNADAGSSPVPPWPVSEDVEPQPRRILPSRPERSDDGSRSRRRTDPPSEPDLPDGVEPGALEDDGHYVPPPPPPVPRLAPQKVLAALAVVAGILLMFAPKLLLQDRTAFVGLMGLLLTTGGAAALIWLMRDAPPTDSGPDDGAVV